MQPLIPYFSGAPHPSGRRLVNVQRCLRTVDIDEVGDDSHLTCFEMLGNWSLGDYYKHESLSLDARVAALDRPAVRAPRRDRLHRGRRTRAASGASWACRTTACACFGREENWWGPPGPHGPCGPDSEIFYIRDDGRWLELGNNVFIVHEQGVGRHAARRCHSTTSTSASAWSGSPACCRASTSVYETDLFTPATLRSCASSARRADERAERIVCDHVRSVGAARGDGVCPSNTEHGYVLRRLLRRAIRQGRMLGIDGPFLREVGRRARRAGGPRRARGRGAPLRAARCGAGCGRSSGCRASTAASSSGSSRPTGCRPS